MIVDPFSQSEYRCRLEWGRRGAVFAAQRGDILVIVDVLSFSSAVATATHHGGFIIPCRDDSEAAVSASQRSDVIASVHRGGSGPYSLSPPSYIGIEPGTTVALASLNGAVCCRQAGENAMVYAGCLLNAAAVAARITPLLREPGANVTVVACGEQWEPSHDLDCLRFAIEDYLGAGAVLNSLPFSKSPEAELCTSAFAATQSNLTKTLWNCGSGRELRKKGYPQDVELACMLNVYDSAPVLRRGQFELDK